MNKPDPARAWELAQKLLAEDELERLDKMTDEEVAAEGRAEGLDPSRVPSVDELLAKAPPDARRLAKASAPAAAPVVPLETRRRARWSVWVGAATVAVAAAVGIVVARRPEPVAAALPPEQIVRARALRDDAERACWDKQWAACEDELDRAKVLDPEGEGEARVVRMRADIGAAARR